MYGDLMGKPDASLFWFMPVAGFIQTLIATGENVHVQVK